MAKVKEFKGYKVPEGATHYAEENDEYEEGFYKNDGINWLYCMPNSNFLIKPFELPPNAIEIPEEEPKQRVKTFKGLAVPEGATHYVAENLEWDELFLKKCESDWLYTTPNDLDFKACTLMPRLPCHAIELPEVFKPEIGTICLGKQIGKDKLEECKLVYFDERQTALVLFKSGTTSYCDPEWCKELKPLQTEEEKAKEAFIEVCFSKSKRAQENKYITHIFEDLFNNGFKAPEDK
jgi:hypothetical protein